ncbi:thermonuclease family protein [Xanthobacter sp. DSM 24535]|uniref:thermonuclease family protein n=1 Tax=Roseixanthobacter psychrophilus TaxID=3119917 RepID=UPI00372AB742
MIARLLLLAALLAATPALALDGNRLRVIDGDTVALGTEHIRLLDIDAPETAHPRCESELVLGLAAKARLLELLRGRPVEIVRHGRDRYGRTLARLTVGGRDVGALLSADGLAIAWRPGHDAWVDRAAHWCGVRP